MRLALAAGAILRGLGQVMFQPDARAGAVFLFALVVGAPVLALAALAGAMVSTGITRICGADVHAGLHGFNGALAGIAMALFPGAGLPPLVQAMLVLAAPALAALVFLRLASALAAIRLPVLTAPFNLVALPVLALVHVASGPLVPGAHDGGAGMLLVLRGVVNGFAQVFFLHGLLPGLLVAAGLALASPRAFGLALAASAGGAVLALVLGADPGAVGAGLFGYNGILTAISLGTVALAPGRGTVALALAAALVTVPAHLALAHLLSAAGLPGLTLAFVLVTWGAVLLARRLRIGVVHG